MLVVAKAGHEEDVQRLFARWGLRSDVIGTVTDGAGDPRARGRARSWPRCRRGC